ncbi:hypothetical protein SINDD18_00405 [Streptococcus infantis]|uniref:Uncharacterized protein n=1 Tax=Streptococcus infantis TaxID=68892 RepID=A0A139RIF4_9STRE|nr:hypothetical protein SINDD18_00405 [Streptococcus infantis]
MYSTLSELPEPARYTLFGPTKPPFVAAVVPSSMYDTKPE